MTAPAPGVTEPATEPLVEPGTAAGSRRWRWWGPWVPITFGVLGLVEVCWSAWGEWPWPDVPGVAYRYLVAVEIVSCWFCLHVGLRWLRAERGQPCPFCRPILADVLNHARDTLDLARKYQDLIQQLTTDAEELRMLANERRELDQERVRLLTEQHEMDQKQVRLLTERLARYEPPDPVPDPDSAPAPVPVATSIPAAPELPDPEPTRGGWHA